MRPDTKEGVMATIQFGVDGVLAGFIHGATRGFQVPTEKVPALWAANKACPWFWEELPRLVEDYTFRRIEALQHAGHQVYFATGRVGPRAKEQTIRWLRHQGIGHPTVILTKKKGETARALNADFAIDDKAGNAISIAYQSPQTASYIIDRPYNRFDHDTVGGKVRRVKTVDDFLDDIDGDIA